MQQQTQTPDTQNAELEGLAAPALDGGLDLDDLLEESTQLAEAKRNAKLGRRLTADQADLLEANRQAAEADVWEDLCTIGHVTKVSCACGNHFREFHGWYKYQEQRRGNGRRLVQSDDHEGLPASYYLTERTTKWCQDCAPVDLPLAEPGDLDLLATLGDPAVEELEPTPADPQAYNEEFDDVPY